ncbi:Probable intramembrane protease [Sparassis crispa]|uniref:Probable intramembrane protease n=1 Tax=Sparassis crispa TaxID=139825 RepID=A0A401GG92_9APHY|nr:Probable intramembrane protease [Sparassis crispa]GBE81200.1 Probable intramembrane protease [Sparassis crispa]
MTDWDLLSSYAGLLTLATCSICAGSYGSLTARKSKPGQPVADKSTDDEEEEEIPERLSSADVYLFPILGSAVLFGLYLVVKFYGEEWINWLLQWYFTVTGVGSVSKSLVSLAKFTLGAQRWKKFDKLQILFLKGPKEVISISMRTPSWYIAPLGAIPSILYTFGPSTTRKSALLTDVLALSFSHNAISLLKLDSFKAGCALLSGLFLYDVWWVFGTEVMVKVATSLDIPIKVLWPKSLSFATTRGFTMLGLGDIVIPGLFVALALRYDHHRHSEASPRSRLKTPYFNSALFAYVAGLFTTMFVMHYFRVAQPALLYLSPAGIISFFVTAAVEGDLKQAWAWSDEPEDNSASDAPKAAPNGNAVTSTTPVINVAPIGPATVDVPEDVEDEEVEGKEKKKAKRRKN